MFSYKRWTSTEFVRSELTIETLTLPKHEKIMLRVYVTTKKKNDCLVLSRCNLWIVWRCLGITLVYCYYFCLEPTVRKNAWARTTSLTVIIIFFKSGVLEVTLITAMIKVPSQHIAGILTTAFGKITYSCLFHWHGLTCVLNLSSRLR